MPGPDPAPVIAGLSKHRYFGPIMRGPYNGTGGYVYILGNRAWTSLYTGVTADLQRRVWEHKNGQGSAFTRAYGCTELLYFELHQRIETAIAREKQLKNWKRDWKLALIRRDNPEFTDLAAAWFL